MDGAGQLLFAQSNTGKCNNTNYANSTTPNQRHRLTHTSQTTPDQQHPGTPDQVHQPNYTKSTPPAQPHLCLAPANPSMQNLSQPAAMLSNRSLSRVQLMSRQVNQYQTQALTWAHAGDTGGSQVWQVALHWSTVPTHPQGLLWLTQVSEGNTNLVPPGRQLEATALLEATVAGGRERVFIPAWC